MRSALRTILFNAPKLIFNFSAALCTFTAGMAKRNAPGPFTAAPIMQGGWATASAPSDVLSFSRGTQVSGNFYTNFDSDQGSINLWLTPEWAGNDGVKHVLLQWSANGMLYKDTDNKLYLSVASGVNISVDISAWTAGTTYHVVARWDSKNTLDGTNYLGISINDVHTFGRTSSYTPEAPAATIYIGSDSSGQNPANAIIEGLTIYRRPLWDGACGINVGNGDEINLAYNAGTGKDSCLQTGSWDGVLCVPTNSAVGVLATGTGEAWTHPHTSGLLGTSGADGLMTNASAWANWTAMGSVTTPALLATAQKIYSGGYSFENAAANDGYKYVLTVTALSNYVIRGLAHSDGVSVPVLELWDESNNLSIGKLTGTITSTRTTPDVFVFAGQAPTGCTSMSVRCYSTAASGVTYWHQVELLANLANAPSMETPTSGDPFLPTGWASSGVTAGDTAIETTNVHSGLQALKFAAAEWQDTIYPVTVAVTAGTFYSVGIFGYAADNLIWNLTSQDGISTPAFKYSASSYVMSPFIFRETATGNRYFLIKVGFGGTTISTIDDMWVFALTAVSLTATPTTLANSTETSGIRVGGRTTLTQPITNIALTQGTLRGKYTPRHSAAGALKFLEVTDVYIVEYYVDANNYIRVYWSAANIVTMAYAMGGVTGSGTWTATGAVAAGTAYGYQVEFTGGGTMIFKFDTASPPTTTRITLSSIPAAFSTLLATAYYGSKQAGGRQADACYAAP